MRSSVFVADMTYIALRSKIQCRHVVQIWFGFSVQFWIAMWWFVWCDSCRTEISIRHNKDKGQKQMGGSQSIDYIYKKPDRLLYLQPNLTLLQRGC